MFEQVFTGELTKGPAASAVVQPLLPPIPKLQGITPTDLHADILAVGYQAWEQANRQWIFGHVFGEKFSHVAEALMEIDLGRNPVQDHFGPDDFPHLKKVEHRARKADFFTVHEKPGAGYQMAKGRGFESLVAKTRAALGGLNQKLDEVIQLMLPMELKHAEVFATVYAAWNNLLMDGLKPTDEETVLAAREKWHPDKLKIDRADFFKTIDWIRKKDICPQGKGKRVVRKAG